MANANAARIEYHGAMNKRLEILLDRVSAWPEEAQEELLRHIVEIETRHLGVYQLSDDERAAIEKGLEAAERGEFASDEEMAAVFKRHGV
jgi:predicted transcriptional regulator